MKTQSYLTNLFLITLIVTISLLYSFFYLTFLFEPLLITIGLISTAILIIRWFINLSVKWSQTEIIHKTKSDEKDISISSKQ